MNTSRGTACAAWMRRVFVRHLELRELHFDRMNGIADTA